VRASQYFNNPEIDVIPAHINLIDKQSDLTTAMASRSRLLNKLKHVNNSYDIVIIDTPPSRDIYAEVALITADYLIIPSDLKPFANQGLPTVKNFIKDINENRSTVGRESIELIGVLASKISTNARFIQYTFPKQRDVIGKRYEMPLMESVIYDSKKAEMVNAFVINSSIQSSAIDQLKLLKEDRASSPDPEIIPSIAEQLLPALLAAISQQIQPIL
jgi:chromosome partitioning protein